MKGDQRTLKREFVLRTNRNSEPVDNGCQNLQQFRNSIVCFLLVEKLIEHVIDRLPNRHTSICQLAIDSMSHCL